MSSITSDADRFLKSEPHLHQTPQLLHSQSGAYAQERTKWEANWTAFGEGKRPYNPNLKYPTAMYRATRRPDGGPAIFEMEEARNDDERAQCEHRGFTYGGKVAALEALEQQEQAYAVLAAERAHDVRSMSARAKAEVEAKEAEKLEHLATIPETPITRRVAREASK